MLGCRGFSGEHNISVKPELRLNPSPTSLRDSLIVVFTMWLDSLLLTCLFTDFAIGCM